MTQKIEELRSYGNNFNYSRVNPHPSIIGTDLIGIEIELENASNITYRSPRWDNKTDGSLRNGGREFVLANPLGGADLIESISEITTVLGGYEPDASWRCSTHLHINIRDLTIPQLKRMMLAYTVYEKVLFKCGSMNRYKNNFCMPFNMAKDSLRTLGRNWKMQGLHFLRNISGSWCKYSSLNLKPMWNWGSVELRIGNAEIDRDRLISMCNRLLVIKAMAKDWEGDSDEAFIEFLGTTPFHNIFNKSICLDYEVEPSDIEEGLINALYIINMDNMLKEQRAMFPDSFCSIASEGYKRDLRNYLESHTDSDDVDDVLETFDCIDWDAVSVPEVHWLLDHLPISAGSILNADDTEAYNSFSL